MATFSPITPAELEAAADEIRTALSADVVSDVYLSARTRYREAQRRGYGCGERHEAWGVLVRTMGEALARLDTGTVTPLVVVR